MQRNPKEARIAIFSDTVDFKPKLVIRDKDRHYIAGKRNN